MSRLAIAAICAVTLLPVGCNLLPGGPPRDDQMSGGTAAPTLDPSLIPDDFTARGHEPGWLVRLQGDVLHYTGQYGEDLYSSRDVEYVSVPDGFRADTDGLSVLVRDRTCRDGATGMPYPYDVTLARGDQSLIGCGGDPADLLSGRWLITDVEGTFNPDEDRMPEIVFDGGTVSGTTGCNRFMTAYEITGEGLSFGPITTTRMACMGELNQQEQSILTVLENVDRFDVTNRGELVLYAMDQPVLRAERD